MSSPSTAFRLFYPDSNTVNAVALHDATGAALTPQTLTDGADDPAGFKSKVLTFAAASEPLFALPTFLSGNSTATSAAAPLNITSKVKAVAPLTPDEIAGAAVEVN